MTTLANDVQVELAAALSDTDTSATIVAAVAPLNNPPTPDTASVLTLVDTLGSPAKVEIVRYTTVTDNGDGTFTIGGLTRGQEGTTAQSFDIGAIAYQAATAGVLAALTTPEMLPAINAPQPGWLLGFGSATEFQWIDPATIGGAGITVDSVSPTTGSVDGGTNIVLTGTGFDVSAPISVTVDGNAASGATVDSDTQISATTPPGTAIGPADITVTQGSNSDTLSGAFEYVPAVWTPADHAGTVVWLDHGDESSITEDGSGNASGVANQISGQQDAAQSDSTRRPTTGAFLIGSENALGFDGSNDRLEISANPFSTIDDAFVFVVVKVSSISEGTLFSLTGDEGVRFQAHAPWADGVIYFDVNGSSGSDRISAASGFSAGDKAILSFYSSTTDGVKEVYLNGTLLVSNTSPTSVSTSGALLVGASMSRAQDHLQGEFVVVDGTVSAADRERFEGWGAHNRGLEAKLPSGHPYKSSPP